jgi:hypothetical protein
MKYSVLKFNRNKYPKLNSDDIEYLIRRKKLRNIDQLNEFIPTTVIRELIKYTIIAKFKTEDGTEYEAIVLQNDGGSDPHFHVIDKATMGDKFDAAISVLFHSYYTHSNGDSNSKLTDEMKKLLNDALKEKSKLNEKYTGWEVCTLQFVGVYDRLNRYNRWGISEKTPQPDYTKLFL